ncbi:MAG: DUF4287 domain-containing protein [Acidobacteriia bacterium]|nr:DUF4287 domain-containing protein [Terriglobia bacterium]
MPAAKSPSGLYSAHPGLGMVEKWKNELPAKTGRSLDDWIALVRKSGPPTEKERREWLKKEYKLGTNTAWWIAERADGKGTEEDSPEAYLEAAEQWVDAMFSGSRAALRPLYDQLLKLALALGKDVKACPGKTIVALYRNHVFAQIKASTNTRIDFGFAFGNMKTPKRLIDTGGYEKKDRITRRIEVKSKADIDDELKRWLKMAYEMDAK